MQDILYYTLLGLYRGAWTHWIRAEFAASQDLEGSANQLQYASSVLKKRRAGLAARWGKLTREGKMKLLLDLTARKATFSSITLHEWERVKKWFRGKKEGLVEVRYRVSEEPPPLTDYLLACFEDYFDTGRGIAIEVTPASDEGNSWRLVVAQEPHDRPSGQLPAPSPPPFFNSSSSSAGSSQLRRRAAPPRPSPACPAAASRWETGHVCSYRHPI